MHKRCKQNSAVNRTSEGIACHVCQHVVGNPCLDARADVVDRNHLHTKQLGAEQDPTERGNPQCTVRHNGRELLRVQAGELPRNALADICRSQIWLLTDGMAEDQLLALREHPEARQGLNLVWPMGGWAVGWWMVVVVVVVRVVVAVG